jgi:hypothetical protein
VRRAVATKEREINMVVKEAGCTDVDSEKMEIMVILAD